MKHIIHLIICFFICVQTMYATFQHAYDPLLVVVLMVKNEETVMRATLQPFIDGGITSFFIFDSSRSLSNVLLEVGF